MKWVIYACAVVLGAVLMAFEMIASRYLTPYFGSGIITWAALISVVLLSMMLGYFLGGLLVDRFPTMKLASLFAAIAGVWFLLVPGISADLLQSIMLGYENVTLGALLASSILLLVPITALGTYSPIALRLMMRTVSTSGSTAGIIYGISTGGNIVGILGTVLFAIPSFGTRTITYALGIISLLCAFSLYWSAIAARPRTATVE